MPKSAQLARLKAELAAHRRCLNEFAASTRRLHELVNGMIEADASTEHRRSATPTSSGPRPKVSGASHVPSAARHAVSAKRQVSTPDDTAHRSAPRQKFDAALERRWGNLF
jgi:hypothetical protein